MLSRSMKPRRAAKFGPILFAFPLNQAESGGHRYKSATRCCCCWSRSESGHCCCCLRSGGGGRAPTSKHPESGRQPRPQRPICKSPASRQVTEVSKLRVLSRPASPLPKSEESADSASGSDYLSGSLSGGLGSGRSQTDEQARRPLPAVHLAAEASHQDAAHCRD